MTSATNTYVQNLYQNVLLRDPDAAGLAYWDSAAVGGLASMNMVENFIASPEAQNITALLRLYDVFFNRAADSAGLTHWLATLKGGASLNDIATAFSGSSEFQSRYATATTTEYVEALYGNLFARTSDAPGNALWVQAIDHGSMTRAEVALAFTLADEAKLETGAATRFAESYLALRSAGVEEPPTAVVEALAQKSLAAAIIELQTVHGTVQNGIIQSASVFRDDDGDGLPDSSEIQNITDADGNFTLIGGYGDLTVTGGTDLTTGKDNDKVLSAPTDKAINTVADLDSVTMVTPLTTIIKAMTDQGMEVETAVSKLNIALGLDANFNPLNFDHTAIALSATSTEAQQKAAVATKGAIAQVTAIMENSAGLIKGAAGTQTDLDASAITIHVAQALADKIIAVTADVTTPQTEPLMALESQTLIKEIINSAAASVSAAGATPISAATLTSISDLATDAAKVIGDLNIAVQGSVGAINDAPTIDASKIIDAFSAIAKSEALSQDTIQSAITAAAAGGDLTAFTSSFTGASLHAAITASPIGAIAAGVESTSGGTNLSDAIFFLLPEEAPSGGGGGDTSAPTLASSSPLDNALAVAVGTNIVLTFSENVFAGNGDIVISNGTDTRTIAVNNATQVSISGGVVTISPTGGLNPNTTYYVQMASGVLTDAAGHPYAGIADTTTLNFNTTDAPTVTVVDAAGITTAYNLSDTAANLAGASSAVLNGATTITVNDTSVTAANLNTIDTNTAVTVNATGVTTITGSATEILAVINAAGITKPTTYVAAVTGLATVAQVTTIDAANGIGATSYALSDTAAALAGASSAVLDGATTITVNDTSVTAANLNTIDTNTAVTVNATGVTEITGSAADIVTAIGGDITTSDSYVATVVGGTAAATNLTTIDNATTATVDAIAVSEITGTAADIATAISSTGIAKAPDVTVRVTAASTSITTDADVKNYILAGAGPNTITLTAADQNVTTAVHASNQTVDTGTLLIRPDYV